MTYLVSNKNRKPKLEAPFFNAFVDELLNKSTVDSFDLNYNQGITLPAVNIKNEDDQFSIEMAVPGMKKSDFNINVEDYNLSISMEKEFENQEETYSRREFGYSTFKRSFALPKTVEVDKISASYKDGILAISLPKREEAKSKPARSISVK